MDEQIHNVPGEEIISSNEEEMKEAIAPHETMEYTPRPFREIPLLWLKIFKMDVAFFENEIRHTSAKNTILSIFLYSSIYSLLLLFLSYINSLIHPIADHPITVMTWEFQYSSTSIPYNAFIRVPLGLYLGSFFMFLAAKLFKGNGTFNEQIYIESIYIPLVQFIETIGRFFQDTFKTFYAIAIFLPLFAFIIYAAILGIRSYRIIHGFTSGKALGIILGSVFIFIIFQTLFTMLP